MEKQVVIDERILPKGKLQPGEFLNQALISDYAGYFYVIIAVEPGNIRNSKLDLVKVDEHKWKDNGHPGPQLFLLGKVNTGE